VTGAREFFGTGPNFPELLAREASPNILIMTGLTGHHYQYWFYNSSVQETHYCTVGT